MTVPGEADFTANITVSDRWGVGNDTYGVGFEAPLNREALRPGSLGRVCFEACATRLAGRSIALCLCERILGDNFAMGPVFRKS